MFIGCRRSVAETGKNSEYILSYRVHLDDYYDTVYPLAKSH